MFATIVAIGQLISSNQAPSDAVLRQKIIGIWGRDGFCIHDRYTFQASGKFSHRYWVAGTNCQSNVGVPGPIEADWQIENAVITFRVTKSNATNFPVGHVVRVKIIRIQDDEFASMYLDKGETNVLTRKE